MAERIEEPAFELVESFKEFDVRRYHANIQARVKTDGGGAASGGFRRVARYIFGGNESGESIAMTAPVSMWEEDNSGWLAFTMPSAYSMEALPDRTMEALCCGNKRNNLWPCCPFRAERHREKRHVWNGNYEQPLSGKDLKSIGPAVLAVYENPWTTLPFMRRNELHIKITNTDEKEA